MSLIAKRLRLRVSAGARRMSSHGGEQLPPRGLKVTDPVLNAHVEQLGDYRDRMANAWRITSKNAGHLFFWLGVFPFAVWQTTAAEMRHNNKIKGVRHVNYFGDVLDEEREQPPAAPAAHAAAHH